MDMRGQFLNDVTCRLMDSLSPEQLNMVNSILIKQLEGYTLEKDTTEITVPDDSNENLLKQFIATKRIEGKSIKTIGRYYSIISPMLYAIGKPIKEISVFDLRLYLINYKSRGVSDRTLNGMRLVFKSFFSWLYINALNTQDPTAALAQIKYEKVVKKGLTQVELEKLKENCKDERELALITFLFYSGCRVSEVVNLNMEHIDFENQRALIHGKGNKQRIIYLSDVAIYHLRKYLNKRTDLNLSLFTTNIKPYNRLSKESIEKIVRNIGIRAGIENVHPHRFRRTCCTYLLNHDTPLQDVAAILGHSDLNTTRIYYSGNEDIIQNSYRKVIN